MDNYRIVLLCEDDFDSIMTSIYDAWVLMNQGRDVAIEVGEEYNYVFLTEYIQVQTDEDKAYKVASSIRRKISEEVYQMIYRATAHFDRSRADVIFRFLQLGYRVGGKALEYQTNPYVMRLIELDKKAWSESHQFLGAVRFTELSNGVLFSKITPKCNVIMLIGEHFADRFPMENWIIYDNNRNIAAVHQAGHEWGIVIGAEFEQGILEQAEQQGKYEHLWKVFFNTIGVESRYNPRCQNTMLPKWYRKNMVEFKG